VSYNETLPIIIKPKHPEKEGEYKEQNGRTSCPRRQKKNHLRG
jgi:hypothetical protein